MSNQWIVCVGKPTRIAREHISDEGIQSLIKHNTGYRVVPWEKNTFPTRKQARARAKECATRYWYYTVKKLEG